MHFLYPSFLWAFLLLSIPVLIHLFQFRRYKTIYFSNVRFLQSVQQESTSQSRLKHLLVLLMRLLTLSALILAFAQPFFTSQPAATAGKNYVSVFIDNSFSMNRISKNFALLDRAKQMATEIVKSYNDQDRFHLLTNNFSGVENRLLSKDEMLAAIEEVNFSPASKTIDAVVKRQREILATEGSGNSSAFIISDFQQSFASTPLPEPASGKLSLIRAEAPANENIGIDTCFFAEPFLMTGNKATLIVKVKNYGMQDANKVGISLRLNGQNKSNIELDIKAGSFELDTFSFIPEKPGWNEAEISLNDEPVTFDNTFYLSFNAISKIPVLSLSETGNKYLRAAFGKSPQFSLEEASAISTLPDLTRFSLVAVCHLKHIPAETASALSSYLAGGGSVVLFTPFQADKESYNKFLLSNGALQIDGFSEEPTQAAEINLSQNIFKDVFEKTPENMRYPVVRRYAVFSKAINATREDILKTKEGNLLVARFKSGKGNLYVCAVAADEQNSELPVSAIFVPMLFKMAVLNGALSTAVFTMGHRAVFEVAAAAPKDRVFKLTGQKTECIPQQFSSNNTTAIAPGNEVQTAGFYRVLPPGSDSALAIIAANYSRAESQMKFLTESELKNIFGKDNNVNVFTESMALAVKNIAEKVHSKPLWKYFLMASLFFLLIETLLLRLWKTQPLAKPA
jgi:hypothetical protein